MRTLISLSVCRLYPRSTILDIEIRFGRGLYRFRRLRDCNDDSMTELENQAPSCFEPS